MGEFAEMDDSATSHRRLHPLELTKSDCHPGLPELIVFKFTAPAAKEFSSDESLHRSRGNQSVAAERPGLTRDGSK